MNRVLGCSCPKTRTTKNRFKGFYFCISVYRENAFWVAWAFCLQYFKWPLEKKSLCFHIASSASSSYHTCMTQTRSSSPCLGPCHLHSVLFLPGGAELNSFITAQQHKNSETAVQDFLQEQLARPQCRAANVNKPGHNWTNLLNWMWWRGFPPLFSGMLESLQAGCQVGSLFVLTPNQPVTDSPECHFFCLFFYLFCYRCHFWRSHMVTTGPVDSGVDMEKFSWWAAGLAPRTDTAMCR